MRFASHCRSLIQTRLSVEIPIDELAYEGRGFGAAETLHLFAIAKQQNGGKPPQTVVTAELHVFIRIHLGQDNLSLILGKHPLEHRRERQARATPVGRKIHQYGLFPGGLDDDLLEVADVGVEDKRALAAHDCCRCRKARHSNCKRSHRVNPESVKTALARGDSKKSRYFGLALEPVFEHRWDLAPKEAIALQQELRDRVDVTDRYDEIRWVAGVDVGFEARNTITRAAVAVLAYPSLELREYAIARQPTRFPYVPGLLSFREVPAVLEALAQLESRPDLLLCDGQGIAHPRRFGIASHLGVLLDVPAIGVAKTRLVGTHEAVPGGRGQATALMDKGETIGAVLRSRTRIKPLFISPGHRVGLEQAVNWVMACTTRYRLPETTRWAHRLASGPELKETGSLGRRPRR